MPGVLILEPAVFGDERGFFLETWNIDTFREAGFDWREPGCSMCVGMNGDLIEPGQRCASTSNRNFEGRQGRGGRTHLVSPAMAMGAAVHGHFVDTRAHQLPVLEQDVSRIQGLKGLHDVPVDLHMALPGLSFK